MMGGMRAGLLLAGFCLVLCGAAVEGSSRPARVEERNGWGSWADYAVGRGSKPRAGEHPLQSYIETIMRGLARREAPAGWVRQQRLAMNGTNGTLGAANATGAEGANATDGAANTTDSAGADGTNATDTEPEGEEEEAEGGLIPVSYGSDVMIPADAFQRGVDGWIEDHPQRIREAFHAMLWGALLFVIATGALIYSEVKTVNLTRELDAVAVAGETNVPDELAERQQSNNQLRPYLSFGAAAVMILSLVFILSHVCMLATEILESVGYAFEGCVVMVAAGALVLTVQWCLFIIGLCWVCTRPFTGALLIILSFIGEVAVEKEEPVAVLVWALFAGVVVYIWLRWGKHFVSEAPEADPEKKRLVSD